MEHAGQVPETGTSETCPPPIASQPSADSPQPDVGSAVTDAHSDGDLLLVAAMTKEGFDGPVSRGFKEELARYALGILEAWLNTGFVFALTARRGYLLGASVEELRVFSVDPSERTSLADLVVCHGVRRFFDKELVGGGWHEGGGASLKSHFVSELLHIFPNAFREWRRDHHKWNRSAAANRASTLRDPDPTSDPAVTVVGSASVREAIERIKDSLQRSVVLLHLEGYSHAEIAEILQMPSARAVEGSLYRWRQKERARVRSEAPSGEEEQTRD